MLAFNSRLTGNKSLGMDAGDWVRDLILEFIYNG